MIYYCIDEFKKLRLAIKDFGLFFSLRHFYYKQMWRNWQKDRDKYINIVYEYLENFLSDQIDQYNSNNNICLEDDSKNIWVCWWQGYNNMPELCKKCFKSLNENIPQGYKIHLITQDNYKDYVTIPEHVLERLNCGYLTITQFSDILREALLYFQGGLWIDSSVWTCKNFYQFINTNAEFWSIKLDHVYKEYMIGQVVSGCMWSGFFMYGKKGNIVTKFAFDGMCAYYKEHIGTIDYFIQNFIIKIGYDTVPRIKQVIDNIHYNNSHLYDLYLAMNNPFDANKWAEMTSDTGAFKLTQKVVYQNEVYGKTTFHGELIDKYKL